MKIPADPTASQSADASVTPEPVRYGNAEVSYLSGSGQVSLVFGRHALSADPQSVRDLYRCLDEIFGPLAESIRAARRAAALADCGVPS
jgi:hypothetical protein